jgi:hypothetical protein
MGRDFNEKYDFNVATSNALLLQFKKPLFFDLSMPDPYSIAYLVAISNRIIDGENISPGSVTCITSNPTYNPKQYLRKDSLSGVSPRVSNGLLDILKYSRDEDSFLSNYMMFNTRLFSNDWIPGKGTWFRFRDGMRVETEKMVNEYFGPKELCDFEKIGNLFQPYIERVMAPHPGEFSGDSLVIKLEQN